MQSIDHSCDTAALLTKGWNSSSHLFVRDGSRHLPSLLACLCRHLARSQAPQNRACGLHRLTVDLSHCFWNHSTL